MSKKKTTPSEFTVMRAFVDALPAIDARALQALLVWIEARGAHELSKRNEAQDETPLK